MKLIKIDKNGTKYYSDNTCQRCGGSGYISYYSFIDNGVCFECGGSGVSKERITKEYTPEYAAKLEAKRQAKAKAKQEAAIAELLANKERSLEKLGFANGKTYCVCGDTYEIKDQLKAAGAKFSKELGWHFANPDNGFECVEISAEEVVSDEYEWSYGKPYFKLVENASEIVKAKMPKKESASEWVGEIGEKVTVTLTLKRAYSYETHYSYYGTTVYIFNFEDADGNVFVWKTSSWYGREKEQYTLTGKIKDHSEYKGTKQTILTHCKEVA